MASGPKKRNREQDECEPWDIGESHRRLGAVPGDYEEEEIRGRADLEEDEDKERQSEDERRHEPHPRGD